MHKKIIMVISLIFVPLILLAAGGRPSGRPVSFTVVESSVQGGSSERQNLLAATEMEFKEIWDQTHRYVEPKPAMPKVDFKKEMIACVMMGERTSSGYSIQVDNVTAYEDSVVIDVSLDETGGMLTVMTYPYQIVKFPTTAKKIIFKLAAAK